MNEIPSDPRGSALQYPVIIISCAAILLAATGYGLSERSDNDDVNDGSIVALPNFWWRALDVPTKDLMMARDALLKTTIQQYSL